MLVRNIKLNEITTVCSFVSDNFTSTKNHWTNVVNDRKGVMLVAFNKNDEICGAMGAEPCVDGMTGEVYGKVNFFWKNRGNNGVADPTKEMLKMMKEQHIINPRDIRIEPSLGIKSKE